MKTVLNPHYCLNTAENIDCIKEMQIYDHAFLNNDNSTLQKAEEKILKGSIGYEVGTKISSPWGENTVLEANIGVLGTNTDLVKKAITINPGFMLSLQRHRGRAELWEVIEGILTVICDGVVHTLPQGKTITVPKGSVHGLINRHNIPVKLIETQTGTCREADNIRLVDFNSRPTVPLQTKVEAQSAILYTQIHEEIKNKFQSQTKPQHHFMSENYRKTIANL